MSDLFEVEDSSSAASRCTALTPGRLAVFRYIFCPSGPSPIPCRSTMSVTSALSRDKPVVQDPEIAPLARCCSLRERRANPEGLRIPSYATVTHSYRFRNRSIHPGPASATDLAAKAAGSIASRSEVGHCEVLRSYILEPQGTACQEDTAGLPM